jgi:histidinol-phosphate aminotransferase
MGRFLNLVNDSVRALGDYASALPSAAASAGVACTPLLKLNANESAYGPSPKAIAAMRAALESSNCYPDDRAHRLRHQLAKIHELNAEQVLIANGTTALLGVIARTLLNPGRNAVTSACSFISYAIVTRATGAALIETPLRDHGYDLDAISAAIDRDTRLVFSANPNNPTGTLVDAISLDHFLDQVPPHVVVVLDEAYYDYARYFAAQRGAEYSRSLDYVRQGRNVVVLRTFSKAHGLAGVRVGYGIGPAELISYFARMQDTFAVSSTAQAAALAALEDEDHIRFAVENNGVQAGCLAAEISKLGYRVVPTWANFFCVEVGGDAREMARRLRQEGILVRPLGAWGAPGSIRVTIGTAEQNRRFVEALRTVSAV